MRRTKIVCTIGPASEQPETLKKLILAGMNVARLNFSHGSHEEHEVRIDRIREVAKELGKNVAIMLDTKGPEIRTGILAEGQVTLVTGDHFILTTEQIEGNQEKVSVTYDQLPRDVHVGATILIDDGLIELKVEEIRAKEVLCRVVDGGLLKNRKGVNLPKIAVNLPSITEKDVSDINFGIRKRVDFIAASFVRKASDVLQIRQMLEEQGANIAIIAKIENEEGVLNSDEILGVADGLMVARGDLGVEIPAEEVPLVQKKLISNCNRLGKPVITATQMLDSMQNNPRPTRAEASDVANAIFDGTDAIMLSGETAAGKYPVESVETMDRIARSAESSAMYRERVLQPYQSEKVTITDAMGLAVTTTASSLHAAAILTPTESGYTAHVVSKHRPACPIVAVTPHEHIVNRLSLVWGVVPIRFESADNTDEMMEKAIHAAVQEKIIKRGDLIIITAGVPVREPGTTNMMKVHIVGKVVARGKGIGDISASGKVVVVGSEGWEDRVDSGTVLVAKATDKDITPYIEKAAGLITEEGGLTSHGAIVGLHLGKAVIIGVEEATTTLKDGDEVTIDPHQGHIYHGFARVL
ncbi:pyruvate kinase [Ammoniphilus sp. CFH 90114]|uniref:pyruvate kinase n=1 Tax=Ammoniphilus sp. CFH 90114 TaxID=2493665 RepID=UPI00100F8E0E|nr:pyruvate kinase [Ammoniphilus sp. CFH 90114]RXT05206.1 pyruvate kinase [Ammoniphilus sp. CFH 90114]